MIEFDVGSRTGKEAIEYSWELGEKAANECTKLFKAPNNLELEKVYCPYFLYSKSDTQPNFGPRVKMVR